MSQQQDFTGIKARMKAMWMAADFKQIAQYNRTESQQFISRLQLPRGAKLLDVACGTGPVHPQLRPEPPWTASTLTPTPSQRRGHGLSAKA